jgi:PPOX class probable F420-dependent enzyme
MSEARSTLTPAEEKFVRWSRVARMATLGSDGQLHNVPVSPALDGSTIVIATDSSARKVRNVEANPRTTLVFDEYSETWDLLRGVVIEGGVAVMREGTAFERGRDLLYEKFRQYEVDAPIEEGSSLILHVTPDRVLSWGF